jgi:hypothetical protein
MPTTIPAVLIPFLRWTGIDTPISPTSVQFHALWQLASAQMIHLMWIQRNSRVYGEDTWTTTRFTDAYNSELRRYGEALCTRGDPIAAFLDHALLEDLPPAVDPEFTPAGNSERSAYPP